MQSRLTLVLLALLVAACSDPADPVDAGACVTCVDAGAPDGGSAGMDAGRDAGGEVDAAVGTDAGEMLDGGSDAGSDASAVGGCDGAICCDRFDPSTCAPDEACRYQIEGGMRTGVACEPAGTDGDGQMCEVYPDGGDSCRFGYFCSGTCFRYCRDDSDCPPLLGRARVCGTGGLAGRFCETA